MERWVQIILLHHGLPPMGLNSSTVLWDHLVAGCHTPKQGLQGGGVLTSPASAATLALKSPGAGFLLERKGIMTPSTWKSECPLCRPLSSWAASLAIIVPGPLLFMMMPFAYVALISCHHGNCRGAGVCAKSCVQNLVWRFPASGSS